jgi:cytochrome bd-type quinol oxidase subunit 1
MKKTVVSLSVFLVMVVFSGRISAQEWTKTQQEVWKVVENEWNSWKSGDIETMTGILHEKYQGWNSKDPLPVSKAMIVEYFNAMKDTYKVDYMNINPARITVTDNSAVVNYFYSFQFSSGEGDQKQSKEFKGRSVEFYTREGGKWQLLGDMMVEDEQDDDKD